MPLYTHRFGGLTGGGENFLFSWWSESAQGIDVVHANAQTWADAFWNGDGSTTGYAQECNGDVQLTSVDTSLIDLPTGRQLQKRQAAVSYAGRLTGVSMPPDVAIVLSLRTDNASRSGRGRFYLPVPAASTVRAGGVIATTTVDNIIAVAGNAWSGYNSSANPVIYSRTYRDTYPITSFDVSNHYDTQRGRDNLDAQTRTSSTMP